MTQLSHLATLGLAKETTPGTWVTPSQSIPFTKADFEDVTTEIRDESIRGNDTTLQGLYPGPIDATWSIDTMAYPVLTGHLLRAIIGPDTVTPGVSTTLSAASTAGATSLSVAASIAANTVIAIDTGSNIEYATVTAVSGSGPYTLTVSTSQSGSTGLANAHASGATVVSQSTHVFKQSTAQVPSYSLTVFDTLQYLGYVGAKMSQLQIKIDPKASVALTADFTAFPGAVQSTVTESYTAAQPLLGWQWQTTNAGGPSTRGLTLDLTIKRNVEAIHGSSGVQAPREVFAGTLDVDGTFKAIFENSTDLGLYANWQQAPLVAALAQPLSFGGHQLTFTMSKSGWYKAKRDLGQQYVQADYTISGIYNTTDGGAVSATLTNFQPAAY